MRRRSSGSKPLALPPLRGRSVGRIPQIGWSRQGCGCHGENENHIFERDPISVRSLGRAWCLLRGDRTPPIPSSRSRYFATAVDRDLVIGSQLVQMQCHIAAVVEPCNVEYAFMRMRVVTWERDKAHVARDVFHQSFRLLHDASCLGQFVMLLS